LPKYGGVGYGSVPATKFEQEGRWGKKKGLSVQLGGKKKEKRETNRVDTGMATAIGKITKMVPGKKK